MIQNVGGGVTDNAVQDVMINMKDLQKTTQVYLKTGVKMTRGYTCFRCGHSETEIIKDCGCKCHG